MKKVLAIAVAGIFVLASCKKDYTCECTTTPSGSSTGYVTTSTVNGTKSDAKTACENGSATNSAGTVVCKIK